MQRFTVEPSASGKWFCVIDTKEDRVVAHKQTQRLAEIEARDWNEFNGPPVRGLADMLCIDPKRARR